MANPPIIESFNKAISSYSAFQQLTPDLLTDLQTQNSFTRNQLLDHITKIISSKKSPPSQRFYTLYFIMKAVENRNEDFIKDLTMKDELTMKIFHASQTDSTKSEMPFERGVNYFSMNPTKSEILAGINFVKLSIELIVALDIVFGDSNPKSSNYVFRQLVISLQKKTKIPKLVWFSNRKYIVPESRELYDWNFNKKSPLLASQSLAPALLGVAPIENEEDDVEEVQQVADNMTQEKKLELIAKAKTMKAAAADILRKNTEMNKLHRHISPSRHHDSDQEETLSSWGNAEHDGLMMTSAPRATVTRFSNFGLVDKREQLKISTKGSSAPIEEKIHRGQKPRQSFISNINRLQYQIALNAIEHSKEVEAQNILSEPGSTPSTKDDQTPTDMIPLGPKITVQRGAEVKKGAMRKSGANGSAKHVLWADTESSPSVCDEEIQERSFFERKGKREITFSLAHENEAQETQKEQENQGIQESTPKMGTLVENNEEVQEKPLLSERRSVLVPRIKITNSEPMPAVMEEKEPTVTGRVTRQSIISETRSHKVLGPKDLGLVDSTKPPRESLIKGLKSPNLQVELQEIENSIRLSMMRSFNAASASSVRSERTSGSVSMFSKTPLAGAGSRISIENKGPNIPRSSKLSESSIKQDMNASRRISNLSSFSESIRMDTDPGYLCSEPSFCLDSAYGIGIGTNKKEDELSKWKCVVVERTTLSKPGSFLNNLDNSRDVQKMYSVSSLKEIEVKEDDSKPRKTVLRVNTNAAGLGLGLGLGKENSGPTEVKKKKIRSEQAVANRMTELLAGYISPDDSKQCLQRVMRPSKYL